MYIKFNKIKITKLCSLYKLLFCSGLAFPFEGTVANTIANKCHCLVGPPTPPPAYIQKRDVYYDKSKKKKCYLLKAK